MTTATSIWTEEIIEVAGTRLQIVTGGSGDPLLILHDEVGHYGALRWHEALAENSTLHIPSHPGFGDSPRMDWVMNMRDLAGWYLRALDELGLQGVDVIGFSLGGWLAAEMATMCPQQFNKMILVGAAGIKPIGRRDFRHLPRNRRKSISTPSAWTMPPYAGVRHSPCRPEEPSPELDGSMASRARRGMSP